MFLPALREVFATIGASGLFAHFIFNRWEPSDTISLAVLLFVVPSALSNLLIFPHGYSILSALSSSFLTYFTALLSSVVVYRLGPWHPLAKYPGPTSLKLSGLYVLSMATSGRRHKDVLLLHERYKSDYVRIGPNQLSIRDASAIGAILGTTGLPKGPVYDGRAGHTTLRSLVNWRDPAVHGKRRKPWSRGMNTTALKEYEPVLAKRVAQLGEVLLSRRGEQEGKRKSEGGVVDLAECINHFAFDFMNDMGFGGGSELMRDGDVKGLLAAIRTGLMAGMLMESLPWFAPHMRKIPSVAKKFQGIRQVAAEKARQRILKGTIVRDLFHYLNNDDGVDPVSPTLEAVSMEGFLVVIAGSDTTSGALCNAMYLLLKHPDVYKRLQEEVDNFYPLGEDALDCKHHSKMTFLDAAINETLRLHPVQPSGSQRATVGQGLMIGSHYIPPYTSVRISPYSIQRDARNFSPAPDAFFPDRWLIAEDPTSLSSQPKDTIFHSSSFTHNMNAFIPFSFGPANCVGKNLALKEMKMVLCHLMQRLEFRFASQSELNGKEEWRGWRTRDWEDNMKDLFVTQIGRLPLVVRERIG